jgi:hypothetical protein
MMVEAVHGGLVTENLALITAFRFQVSAFSLLWRSLLGRGAFPLLLP